MELEAADVLFVFCSLGGGRGPFKQTSLVVVGKGRQGCERANQNGHWRCKLVLILVRLLPA